MSASKDKLQRKQQIEAGTDKRTIAAAKEKAQHRKSVITYTVVAVLVVVFFAFIFIYNSSWPARLTTAVTIDGQDYSVAQLNYYYANSYMTFYSNYADYINYGLFFDPSTSLAEQDYSQDMTWREYFLDAAVQNMAQIQMLNDKAEEAGFTLSEEQQADYEQELDTLLTAWQNNNYTNLKQYLNMNFGKGVDEDMVRQELYRAHVASAYGQSIYDGYEYTDAELDDYYAEHADELDVIDYAYYTISKPTEPAEDTEDTEDTEDEETSDDAEQPEETEAPEETPAPEETAEPVDGQAMAEAIDGADLDAFTAYLEENVGEDTTPTHSALPGSSISTTYSEWLLDADRQAGDATCIETDSAYYVVMFLSRETNDYPLVSFRHILARAEDADGDGTFSDEEIQAAEDEANSAYDEWQAGDATEDSFAALANERSDDTGSNTTGGLYENVAKGNMVDPINDWLFEDGRQAGDTTVVSYDGPNYTGSHVVYFVGQDDMSYARRQADSTLRSNDYSAWLDESLADYTPVTAHLGMAGKIH